MDDARVLVHIDNCGSVVYDRCLLGVMNFESCNHHRSMQSLSLSPAHNVNTLTNHGDCRVEEFRCIFNCVC